MISKIKTTKKINENESDYNSESGQVFFEFILLLVVMLTLSYAMLYAVNGNLATRWQSAVHLITKLENSSPPELR